jgi:hypothetical protein
LNAKNKKERNHIDDAHKERIAARAEATNDDKPKAERRTQPTLKLKGFWAKTREGNEPTTASWVANVTGLGYGQENDRMTLTLSFDGLYLEIDGGDFE